MRMSHLTLPQEFSGSLLPHFLILLSMDEGRWRIRCVSGIINFGVYQPSPSLRSSCQGEFGIIVFFSLSSVASVA